MMLHNIASSFIRLGIVLIIIGGAIKIMPNLAFAPLPGDIILKKENFTLYFPITTMIVISIILTVLVNIFFKK